VFAPASEQLEARAGEAGEFTRLFRASQPPIPKEVCVPSSLPLDNVHFTVTAPAAVRPGESFMLQFWAHLQTDLATILDLSRLTLRTTDLFYASEGPFLLERGTRITVEMKIAEL
jgi:hypothetical protein